ncbi:uncharacterized protein LOC126999582 [Eriocheir sinensis]|uniref:uncharacterized protein LOC126999582 n=1 Tax=Eriocheir sinensis TaxID=95602 RepID=UPI0021C91CF1|nr:uncharacterized protein LOC126999582 [Eriocheir sinensis]
MTMQIAVVVLVLVGSVTAWPINSPDLKIAGTRDVFVGRCGEAGDVTILPSETLNVILNAPDSTEDCEILLRVSIKDDHLTKYGLQVSGHLRLEDDDCSASSLVLQDNDDETDEAAISETFCGTSPVSYNTVEDVVIFTFLHRGHGREEAGGSDGLAVTVAPKLVCGGVVPSNATLTIPDYSFQAPYVCNWRLVPGEGQRTRVTFQEFSLKPPRKQKCTSDCLYFVPADMEHYCGTQLLDSTKELPGQNLMSLRVNSATTKFSCTVEYIDAE